MKQIFRKSTAILLVLVQLLVLCPFGIMQAQAAEAQAASAAVPALNKTIVGTVKFQSFNFLGDNKTGDDGVDYTSTFYYTDDYFSHSAINDAVSTQSVPWSQLDDASLAACSMDLAVASYTTNAGNIVTKGGKSYANTNYTGKFINAKNFLETCGFEDFESVNYEVAPTADSIAYCLAHKEIYVWDEATRQNKTFQLVAVGVRGAGYGAEWANNVTIGTPGNGANVVRHEGFDNSAKTVCAGVEAYIKKNGISQDVKYWISGFSRAAAVANLAAGYLTDNKDVYHAEQRDIYGYTYECPQAASTSENALNYKNIHNILNAMDAVPKVSPSSFNHQRLGVDYVMPYYGNTSAADNTKYYTGMRNVLQTIAVGTTIDGAYEEDPLIAATNPNSYPYNRPVTIYKMSATKLVTDAIGGNLMTEFGTEVAKKDTGLFSGGNVDRVLGDEDNNGTADWYMDKLIDELIQVFLTSTAFDRGYSNSTTNMITHRTRFIDTYQDSLRTLFAYFLDFSGPAFLGLVDQLMDQIAGQLKLSNAGFALAFVNFYNDPTGSYGRYNFLVDSSWRGKPHKDVLISEAKGVAVDVADDLTEGYNHPTITREQMHTAMEKAVGLVIDLYADELDRYESQYFGTFLRQLNVILSTHEQETVISWIKSLDDNHISDVRKITLPVDVSVDLYVFREGLEGALDQNAAEAARAQGALVARVQDGAFVPLTGADGKTYDRLDDRITLSQSGSSVVITYPGTMDLRIDVQGTYEDMTLQLADLAPKNTVNTKSTATRDSKGHITATQIVTDGMVQQDNTPTARTINTFSNGNAIELAAGETLSVIAWHGSNQVVGAKDASYALYKTTPKTVLIDFGSTVVAEDETLMSGSSTNSGTFAQSGSDVTYTLRSGTGSAFRSSAFADTDHARVDDPAATETLKRGESITAVPASSVYYDDDLVGQTFTSDGHGYSPDLNDTAVSKSASAVSGTFYFTFYGTGIDAYCTTDDESGYVSAAVFRGAGAEACVKANRVGSAQTVSNKSSEGTRYNTPTISFVNLGEQDTYTLKISANDNAKFKLDGVRVYNPVQDGTAAAAAQEASGEGNTLYVNLHEMLVNTGTDGFSVMKPTDLNDGFDKSTISGILFIDDTGKLAEKTHYDADGIWHEEEFDLYATQFDAYKNNSPNNEIYLAKTQAITFQVNTAKAPVGSTIYIGMSAPETGRGEVSVTGNAIQPVTSVMDMYYGITVPTGGLITITNVGSSLISLTNLKITNVTEAKTISAMPASERLIAMRTFFAPVTTETVELAAQSAETAAPAPTPEPTPNDQTPALNLSQLISGFVQNLFSAFSRLFRP